MRSLLFLLVLFFGVTASVVADEIVIDFTHPKFARLDAEGRKLLSEYAKVYPSIRNFYENMRMDVTVKKVNYLSEQNLQSMRSMWESEGLDETEIEDRMERSGQSDKQYEIRYRLSEGYRRLDEKVSHPVTPSIRPKLPAELSRLDFIQETGVTLFTPKMGYQLSRNDPLKQYFSLNVRRDLKNPNTKSITTEAIYFDVAPFFSEYTPLGEILFQSPPLVAERPYRVIEYVQQKEIVGKHIVEVRCVLSTYLDANPDSIHRVVRLCRDSWVAKETFVRTRMASPGEHFGKINWVHTLCTYDGMHEGIPLLKTYQRSNGDYNKETQEEIMTRQILAEVTHLVPGPPDLSEFDVAQFLPPGVKVGEITPARLSTARIVTIVISIILIILGIYLKIRNARKE